MVLLKLKFWFSTNINLWKIGQDKYSSSKIVWGSNAALKTFLGHITMV